MVVSTATFANKREWYSAVSILVFGIENGSLDGSLGRDYH
jgi:hypothetical protein